AEVGVNFDQEIAAYNHRLGFRMIDVRRNNGAAARNLCPHELRCYLFRDVGAETLSGVLMSEVVAGEFGMFGSDSVFFIPHSAFRIPHLFSDCDELHLGRNDATPRVSELCDSAGLCSEWFSSTRFLNS